MTEKSPKNIFDGFIESKNLPILEKLTLSNLTEGVAHQARKGGDRASERWPKERWGQYIQRCKEQNLKTFGNRPELKSAIDKYLDQVTQDKKNRGELI